MKSTVLSILSIFLFSAFAVCNETSEETLQDILKDVQRSVGDGDYPSVAVAVAIDGDIVFEGGYGYANLDQKIIVNEHTMYSLASISKPITTTGLMLLVERGLIDLDKPVNNYLSDAKLNVRVGNPEDVTVKRVAQHTAGLPLYYHFFYEDEPYKRPSMDETIRKYGNVVFEPGDLYQYSNIGYGVLDYVIERVSGKSYPEFMKDDVFIPLQMNNTAVLTPDTYTGNEAVRYDNSRNPIPFYDFDHRGASAVYASAHDLALFGLFHLERLQSGQTQIFSAATKHIMHNEVSPFGNYSIGWGITDHKGMRVLQHTGGMGGVRTVLTLVPELNAVITVLTNCENGGIHELKNRMLRVLSKDIVYEKAVKEEEAEKEIPSLDGTWRGSVHTYVKEIPFAIHVEDHVYTITFNNEDAIQLKDVHFNGEVLTGNFLGDIQTPDEYNPGYSLDIKVVVKDGGMYGAVTSLGDNNGRVRNALSHFVQLNRVD